MGNLQTRNIFYVVGRKETSPTSSSIFERHGRLFNCKEISRCRLNNTDDYLTKFHLIQNRHGNFQSNDMVARPLLFLTNWSNRSNHNITTKFQQNLTQKLAANGRYVCAILPLNSSSSWDLQSCTVDIKTVSQFQCHCPYFGTTLLLYVKEFPRVI